MELTDQEVEQASWAGRKRIVDIGGLDLAYVEIAGAEPPLLLIHGFTDTSRSFSLLTPHLSGRRLIMPDLRGHGASNAGEGCSVVDFAEDIAGLIRRLRLDRPVVVGHSLGGMVSIALAAQYPELIGGMVILASTLKPDFGSDHQLIEGVAALRDPISPVDPFYDWWHACRPGVPRAFLAGLAKDASAIPAARWRAILEEVRGTDLTAAARAVQAPTLIIAGGRDPLFGEAHQRAMAGALAGSRLVWAQDCGHNPHWEDPAFVAEAIAGMLPAA
ncbi:alpha/beta hydrolase [Mesorhizobium sp. CA18]|uniref:alpha/beta fold hydrolase n=1 Tax=unclassified Mesorhizobium TaxID=325217 RepID=UPI001CCC3E63|nr:MULTISPECIES: alpha/beta hydrolase [unclassified Mesorhizobium]MBZ9736149.1 alpha/beta hydrolase [Mesorhizobium sp. CA9]MBZ9827913.1 alpha/beta hydrolase [Mesorhizobium sp. CA18]MBZ9833719.1 alpha/beta hydrolase [Mesorhizobium sp. CA2]MBZ9839932.1 alpha/beta hydrolase [Mesorhizobium sp. CA3]MBZ9879934.1 alpha/beta hydrolase [Mesorhizobium sp. Ca11]